MVQDQIGLNRAKARVAADLSGEGMATIEAEQAMEKNMAEQALRDFEVQKGLVTPETAPVVIEAGATALVAGSAVFGRPPYDRAIAALRG
jgi:ribulose-phosphate 3-epimerase